jgi:hypothetical protein
MADERPGCGCAQKAQLRVAAGPASPERLLEALAEHVVPRIEDPERAQLARQRIEGAQARLVEERERWRIRPR